MDIITDIMFICIFCNMILKDEHDVRGLENILSKVEASIS